MRFEQISDYLKYSDIHVDQKLDDFLIYSYEDVNEGASISREAYQNDFYEISLELTAGCSFKIDQFEFPVESKRLSVINPRRLQSTTTHVINEVCKGYTLFFSPDFLRQHLNESQFIRDYQYLKSSNSPVISLDTKTCNEITSVFHLIKYEHDEYGRMSKEVIRAYLNALLEKAAHHYQPTPNYHVPDRNNEITMEFEYLTEKHIRDYTTVKEYADLLHISNKHLSQVIRKTTGKRALDIISAKRINAAKSLLSQTSMTISEIAFRLKFASTDYFITFFKHHTGITPVKFRLSQS